PPTGEHPPTPPSKSADLGHAGRRSERAACVSGKSNEDAPLILGHREPRDRDVAPARADRGPVDRAGVDLPVVPVDRLRLAPPAVGKAGHVNVAGFVLRSIAERDD